MRMIYLENVLMFSAMNKECEIEREIFIVIFMCFCLHNFGWDKISDNLYSCQSLQSIFYQNIFKYTIVIYVVTYSFRNCYNTCTSVTQRMLLFIYFYENC